VPSYRQLLPRAAAWNPPTLPSDKKHSERSIDITVLASIVVGVALLDSILVFAVRRICRRRPAADQPPPPTGAVAASAFQGSGAVACAVQGSGAVAAPYHAFPVNGRADAAIYASD
jgi:hypothetical protein